MSTLRLVTDDGIDPGPQSPPVVVLFCGSRNFNDRTIIETLVQGVSAVATLRGRPFVMVEGEANGADIIAREEAENIGVKVIKVKADWERYGKKAGILRNIEMLNKYQPEMVVAFTDDVDKSRDVRRMCRLAQEQDIDVYVVGRYGGPR